MKLTLRCQAYLTLARAKFAEEARAGVDDCIAHLVFVGQSYVVEKDTELEQTLMHGTDEDALHALQDSLALRSESGTTLVVEFVQRRQTVGSTCSVDGIEFQLDDEVAAKLRDARLDLNEGRFEFLVD